MAVSIDVFPAELHGPIGKRAGLRILVNDDQLLVFSRSGDVKLEARATVAETQQQGSNRRAKYTVTDTDGGVWVFGQNGVCPCGSPFKRMSAAQMLALVEG